MDLSAARREGFANQHMFVLPEPLRAAARRHPLLRALHVTDAGFFPAARGHRIERRAGAPTTLVILCRAGHGWFRSGGPPVTVTPGDLVWLPPRQAHAYGADAAEPWTIAWVHFAGEEAEAWRRLLADAAGTNDRRVSLPASRLDEIGLEEVYRPLERGHALRDQVAAVVALRSTLQAIVELAAAHRRPGTAHERVAAAAEKLRRDWRQRPSLRQLAAAAGMSVTHFSALFRRRTGFSPVDFLIRQRVRQAGQLLDGTSLSVREIAEQVGYEDPYYFSRCFRRVMGCSPRAYRKVPKG
ncbi:MAG TPA: AraC family transcriptional regulator [Lacunisphaera sp.]|nr:AraC family transcriptional regulator [Lacunisphaera sp.]